MFSFVNNLGSEPSFDNIINNPSQTDKTSPSEKPKRETPSNEGDLNKSKKGALDEKARQDEHHTKCEKMMFNKLEYHIFNNNLDTLFKPKPKNLLNVFKNNEVRPNSFNKKKNIMNENIIKKTQTEIADKDLLICPVPNRNARITKDKLASSISNKFFIQNNINLNTNLAAKQVEDTSKAFNELIDFNQKNKMEQDIHRQLVNILRKNLTDEKLYEIVKNTTDRFSNLENCLRNPKGQTGSPLQLKGGVRSTVLGKRQASKLAMGRVCMFRI
jgi:hypothetical protein